MGSLRWRRNRRLKCECGGYHFPHRKGGGACAYSRTALYHLLRRQGADHETAFAEWAFEAPGKPSVNCPF